MRAATLSYRQLESWRVSFWRTAACQGGAWLMDPHVGDEAPAYGP